LQKNGVASLNLLKTINDDDINVQAKAGNGKSLANLEIDKNSKSKSSMNNNMKEFDAVMYPPNRRFPRQKPVSVWD